MEEGKENLNADAQGEVLQTFSTVLQREKHNLVRQPDLLWQQLFNRLQWEGDAIQSKIAAAQYVNRGPWLKTLTKYKESQALLRMLSGHTNQVNACDYSPDGTRILSAGKDQTWRIWDLESGQVQIEIGTEKPFAAFHDACFSPDGLLVLTAGADKTLSLWDAGSGEALNIFGRHSWEVKACTFSPDGSQVLSACNQELHLFSMKTGQEIQVFRDENAWHYGYADCTISPDNRWVVAPGRDKKIRIWEVQSGALVFILEMSKIPCSCAFSPDAASLAFGHGDDIRLLEFPEGEVVQTLTGHTGQVRASAFSTDMRFLVSTSDDGTLRLWDVPTGETLAVFEGHTAPVLDVAFAPDGQTLISAGKDHTLCVWDAAFRGSSGTGISHTGSLTSVRLSPEGDRVLSASEDKNLKIWEASSGAVPCTFTGHSEGVNAAVWMPDGQRVLSVDNNHLFLWEVDSQEILMDKKWTKGWLKDCDISNSGQQMVTSETNRTLTIWDATTGDSIRTLNGHQREVYACGFSPDGKRIVSGEKYRVLFVWEAASGKILVRLQGHKGAVRACRFSPDGSKIVSANEDETARIWDANSGEMQVVLSGRILIPEIGGKTAHERNIVTDAAFSPDNRWVFTCGMDQVLRVWNASSGELEAQLPLLGGITALDPHPWKPIVICGDEGGTFYQVAIIGIDYGPIIITSKKTAQGLSFRCPACKQDHPTSQEQLGNEMTCLTPGCGLRLQLNPFVIELS
jgi:WD40 repeat protein